MEYQAYIELFEQKIKEYREKNLKVFLSSSFQSHSIPLIHLISRIDPEIPVVFLNTGFHFPETLAFRDEVIQKFGLKLINVASPIPKVAQRNTQQVMHFATNPDYCCYLNKTLPMEPILGEYDVWISGVRKAQSSHRAGFAYESPGKFNTLRFHPMLEWSNAMIWAYAKQHNLPRHPLEAKGYLSIGCEPCTQSIAQMNAEQERAGRWAGLNKVECGLHTDLMEEEN